jgi:hypothetical protein
MQNISFPHKAQVIRLADCYVDFDQYQCKIPSIAIEIHVHGIRNTITASAENYWGARDRGLQSANLFQGF